MSQRGVRRRRPPQCCGPAGWPGRAREGRLMRFICDAANGQTWFQFETEAEAAQESKLMRHAVEKHFRLAYEEASQSYDPAGIPYIEQDIRRGTHIQRAMSMFLTLRDDEGRPLVTAMLPAAKGPDLASRPV